MFTIIGGDGKEYGPASAEQLRAWITSGRASLETKAKAIGSDEWRRLGDYAEFFPTDDAPPIIGAAATAGDSSATADAATLIARARPLDVFSCLDRSFTLWKKNLGPLVGATLLTLLLLIMLGFIPILGAIAGLFLDGVFYGGLYYYYLGKMRGQPREIGDIFAGFKQAFVPLMLSGLMITLITLAILLPFAGPLIYTIVKAAMQGATPNELPDISGVSLLLLLVGGLIVIYLSMAWVFTFALVIDKKISAWTAMELSRRVVSKQWFRVFAVVLLGCIVAMLGLIGLIIGVLFTLPLMLGAVLYAYEDLCNPPA